MSDFGWAFVKGGLLTGSAPPDKSVQFNNGSSGLGGSADFTFDTSTSVLNLTGTLNVSGAINANQYNVDVANKTVINLTATGSTKFGDTTDDKHVFTGSLDISASTNPIRVYGLQAGTPPNTSSYIALDSNYQLVLTSAAGGASSGGTIGDAEDGTYTDGLFSDFTDSTPIGTAIDKINEILKIIVPGPAPSVDQINYTNTSGVGPKLSINNTDKPAGYVAVANTGSFSDSLDVNSEYSSSTSGEDFRLGSYNGTQEITGVINHHVAEQLKSTEVNYSTDAFGNAESGSLNLYLNGALLHTLNLSGFAGAGNPNTGSASDLNSSGSGFFDISVSASATDQNGSTYDIFQHRTAKYVIDPNDQNKGWNYAKVEHVYGSTTYVTNFIQWFNDTDASTEAMSVSNERLTINGQGSKYLSGVQYFLSASVTYNAEVANVYKFTYPTGNVLSFNQTNLLTTSAQSLPAIGGSEDYTKTLEITASSNNSNSTMLGTTFTRSINLTHPFKSNLSSAGSVTSDGILIYDVTNPSTNLNEYFDDETYRITSGAYGSQGAVTDGAARWDSESSMALTDGVAGHSDGLLFFNSNLYSPKNTPPSGITNGNFSALGGGPAGNPDYSGESGTRTFYRKIQNTSGGSISDLKITTEKSSRINNSSLTTNNVQFYVKIPGTTGWMDISQDFTYGAIADGDGALINGASDNSNTGATATGDSDHCVTFGTASVANNEYVVVKILADAAWTSYIENITFQLGASDVAAPTEADPLDDIDLDDTAGETVNLSFGTSNSIGGYTNVTGGLGSMVAVDSNETYTDNGDTNRGAFKALEVMGGTLNEDVVSDGNNHPANSFNNAYTGSLLLIVNDSTASTLSLANLNATNNLSSGTGFTVGAVGFSTTSDGIPDYTKPYRTGTYSIGTGEQRSGWNYARVIHRIGASDTTTNYVQWVVDPSGSTDDTNVSSPTFSEFNHTDIYYQSGIGYFASNPTASFSFTGSNFYSNVYSTNAAAISFSADNSTVTNIRVTGSGINTFNSAVASTGMPDLNDTADCETTSIEVTGTIQYNGSSTSISGAFFSAPVDVTVSGRVRHPFKSDRTTSNGVKTAFMRYSGSLGSTTLTNNEYFGLETYRIVSGNYANQAELTSSSNTWNSQTEMDNGGSHDDGMVTANGYVLSPFNIGNAGDTRNNAEGTTGLQAPAGNPNYSTLTNNTRTYYRLFIYTGVTTISSFSMNLYGDATLVSKDAASPYYAALGANKNCTVELKVSYDPNYPGADDQSTGWTDVAKIFDAGNQPNNDGAGIRSGASSGEDVTIDGDSLSLSLTLGTRRIKQNQYYVVKVSAHKDWTGYISRIQVTY